MIFLGWANKQDAEASLAAVDAIYGCPYVAENGYRMDNWAHVNKLASADVFGFIKPEARLGCKLDILIVALVPGFSETLQLSSDFVELKG